MQFNQGIGMTLTRRKLKVDEEGVLLIDADGFYTSCLTRPVINFRVRKRAQ